MILLGVVVTVALWVKFGWFWGLLALIACLIDVVVGKLED